MHNCDISVLYIFMRFEPFEDNAASLSVKWIIGHLQATGRGQLTEKLPMNCAIR